MKRIATIAGLVVLVSAVAVTGAYAAAPDTVSGFFAAICEACGIDCFG